MRYAELRPVEFDAVVSHCPVAIWPIGALEWHGPHLPLGLDGLVAEAFGERLRARVGGLLLPTLWHPITTLPHPLSLEVSPQTFRRLLAETADGLAHAGIRVLCLVSGHYAQGHSLELFALAQASSSPLLVLAASPLEPLEDEDLLDHAGWWEASQLIALRPELADLGALPEKISTREHAIIGQAPIDPDPQTAIEKGERALDIWQRWIEAGLQGERAEIDRFYERRIERYRPYVERYFRTSWPQALADWWADQA